MPTVTKYPSANQAAGGVFNGSWLNPNNAHADDAQVATCAPGKNQEFASVWQVTFAAQEVPDGATLDSVTVEVQWKVSTTSSLATLRSTMFADSGQASALSASPGVNDTAEPTTDTTRSYSATPTLQNLRDGVWVRVQALRGNTNTAYTASLDFVRVTVTYSDPPAGITGSGGLTLGAPAHAASASQRFVGSGGLALTAPSLTSSGRLAFRASGALALTAPAIDGTGALRFTGSGAVTITAPSIDGANSQTVTGSGSVGIAAPSVSGTGALRFVGSGGVGIDAPSVTGSGAMAFSGTGSASLDAPAFVGSGGLRFVGTGSIAILAPTLDGTAALVIRGSGSTGIASPAISGSGTTGAQEAEAWADVAAADSAAVACACPHPDQAIAVSNDTTPTVEVIAWHE